MGIGRMPARRNIRASTEHRRGGASRSSLDAIAAEKVALQELRDRNRSGVSRETLRSDHADDITVSELPVIFLQRCDGRTAHKKVGGNFMWQLKRVLSVGACVLA